MTGGVPLQACIAFEMEKHLDGQLPCSSVVLGQGIKEWVAALLLMACRALPYCLA